MPHFFIKKKNVIENVAVIEDKENYQHIVKSLRAKIGEKILLIDEEQIQYEGIIKNIDKEKVDVSVEKSYKSSKDLDFDLYLAQSPLRSDSQNFIVEKATELGVRGIYPVYTDNCALKKEIIIKKIEKWQKIMFEASKQCERAKIPTCFELTTLEKLLDTEKFDKILAFCERCSEFSMQEFFVKNPIKKSERILAIIGPEGGFSKKEFELFQKRGIIMLSLGDLILKAETAAVVSIGNLIYEFKNCRKN